MRSSRSHAILAALVVACFAGVNAFAAEANKRPFTHRDFDSWRSLSGPQLSRDGRYLAYAYMPLEGDGDVVVRTLNTGEDHRVPVGALPPPPFSGSEADPERPAPRRAVTIALTSDSRFAVATVFPTQAEVLAAKRAKKTSSEMPVEGMVVIRLDDGKPTSVANVKNFQVPANGGPWLAYLRNPPRLTAATSTPDAKDASTQGASGAELVLRDLNTQNERMWPNVVEYSFARDGKTLVFVVASDAGAENGIFAVTPGDTATPLVVIQGPGKYLKFTWDRQQTQAAFLSDRDDAGDAAPRLSVYHWVRGADRATKVLASRAPGIPLNAQINGDATPAFSYDGRKLFVPASTVPAPPDPRLASLLDEEQVHADLWRWNDDFLPTLQKARSEKDRKRAYLGSLDLASNQYTQVADESLAAVTFNDDGSLAFGTDDRPYRRRIDYAGIFHDLYLVDSVTGGRRLVVQELGEKSGVRWSHNNRWIAYYADGQWFALDARDGSLRTLTADIPVPLYDERADLPESPASHGTAGWSSDGESLLIYDRYDLWQAFPDGRPARNLTGGYGRQHKIQLRLQPTDASEPGHERRGVPLDEPVIFRGESETTRATGFFRFAINSSTPPERLLWADKDFRYVGRALAADKLLLTASRFDEYPDLLTTDPTFSTPQKVSHGGDQLAPFLWGSAELIDYRNTDGVELSAMLCKPANFDPSKKYPMIVYIYERLSQIVNRFMTPAPTTVIDPAFYTSNGYIVLMPDIVYTIGHPGQSAYRCVMPAVDAVVRLGYVDEQAIGLQGHSWGGYETAYLITQTDRFRAAEAGAIVSNMISAYGGIGWSSGRSRQFKYEKTQSRIGATPAEAPLLYVENSPVFFAPRVNTPLLMLHNDHDDVVPWYQSIEFFLALRRAGKEVYFFNYNNELHGLRRRVDQKDFARRMHQFFDHFLKGAPAPEWMTHGIPYLERAEEKLRFHDAH
jgi:dipeptidyl aminopeptidase/acylaminoacyl peptidase